MSASISSFLGFKHEQLERWQSIRDMTTLDANAIINGSKPDAFIGKKQCAKVTIPSGTTLAVNDLVVFGKLVLCCSNPNVSDQNKPVLRANNIIFIGKGVKVQNVTLSANSIIEFDKLAKFREALEVGFGFNRDKSR